MGIQKQHIAWVDGAKGVAIIAVFVMHAVSTQCLRSVGWIFYMGQAVPVFLFITAYLASTHYRTLRHYYALSHICTMLKRVFVPFIAVQAVTLLLFIISGNWWSWKALGKHGGLGPGSYYVWIYIQIWFLLPLIIELVKRIPIKFSFLVMLIVSLIAEYIFVLLSNVEHIDSVYELMPIRYFMILYAGCVWDKLSNGQKNVFYAIAVLSGVLMLVNVYFAENQLVSITPPYWKEYHWYSVLYVLCPIALLQRIHYTDFLYMAGKYSWQLFLLQMMCYAFVSGL